jgi:hypothetical protein
MHAMHIEQLSTRSDEGYAHIMLRGSTTLNTAVEAWHLDALSNN